MRTKCTPSGIWYLERYFLESERKSACFLPYGREHGNRLSTSKYLHPHSDTGAGQVSDGRNDQPQSDCRHLQSGYPKTVYLKAGDPTDRYFTNISWSPDEKSVYVIELNRDQNHALLCCYDAETGEPLKSNPLYEEKHTKYVEPQHPIVFLPWDHTKFIYQSQRDGYNHLYLMDTKTSVYPESHGAAAGGSYRESYKTRQLTQGNWVVQNILGFNEKTKEVIIMSTEVSPLQSNAYAVNVKTGKRRLIGNKDGMHHVQLSGNGNYVIDNYTSFTIPRNIEIVPTSGKGKTISLLTATNPLEAYNMPEITVGTLKAADGKTDLYYRLIKPVNFDPNKKYPAVVYVYGGPHAQLIHNNRNYDAADGIFTWHNWVTSC